MYTVLTFRPEYQYPLYIVVRRRVLRFCARVKARFSVRVFGLKKLFLKHTTRTEKNVFAALHRQPRSAITEKFDQPSEILLLFVNYFSKTGRSIFETSTPEFYCLTSSSEDCPPKRGYIWIFSTTKNGTNRQILLKRNFPALVPHWKVQYFLI